MDSASQTAAAARYRHQRPARGTARGVQDVGDAIGPDPRAQRRRGGQRAIAQIGPGHLRAIGRGDRGPPGPAARARAQRHHLAHVDQHIPQPPDPHQGRDPVGGKALGNTVEGQRHAGGQPDVIGTDAHALPAQMVACGGGVGAIGMGQIKRLHRQVETALRGAMHLIGQREQLADRRIGMGQPPVAVQPGQRQIAIQRKPRLDRAPRPRSRGSARTCGGVRPGQTDRQIGAQRPALPQSPAPARARGAAAHCPAHRPTGSESGDG